MDAQQCRKHSGLLPQLFRKSATMNETPNTRTAELFDAMVAAYETWAEPLSARLAQVALKRTSVRAGDSVLDIGAGTGFWHFRQRPSGRESPLSIFRSLWSLG
jgi:hypothetical protein